MSTKLLRVAAVQHPAAAFDLVKGLEVVRSLSGDASSGGADIVLFPEVFLPGYPAVCEFPGGFAAFSSDDGPRDFQTYYENAIELGSREDAELGQIARDADIQLHIGVMERIGGSLFNTLLSYDQRGRFAERRKLMPSFGERTIWAEADGSTLRVHRTPLGRIGAAICWENYMPLLRTVLYAGGIEIYLAPTAEPQETWIDSMRHIALEGRCFVVSCSQVLRPRDFPEGYLSHVDRDADDLIFPGRSCIISPFGKILAEPVPEESTILFADLDLSECVRGKCLFDVVGHYSRPDLFQLTFDDRRREILKKLAESDHDARDR